MCNNCPNRTVKAITQVTLEPVRDPAQEDMAKLDEAFGEEEDTEE